MTDDWQLQNYKILASYRRLLVANSAIMASNRRLSVALAIMASNRRLIVFWLVTDACYKLLFSDTKEV